MPGPEAGWRSIPGDSPDLGEPARAALSLGTGALCTWTLSHLCREDSTVATAACGAWACPLKWGARGVRQQVGAGTGGHGLREVPEAPGPRATDWPMLPMALTIPAASLQDTWQETL